MLEDFDTQLFFRNQWKMLEQMLDGSLPLLSERLQNKVQLDGDWIDQYVNEMLKKSLDGRDADFTKPDPLAPEVFATHDDVIVKLTLPPHVQPEQLRAFAAKQELRIEGLPDKPGRTIALPHPVTAHSCRGFYKDGILEFRLARADKQQNPHEVKIRFFD